MSILRNSVKLHGNVGADPEVKYLNNGSVIAKFSLATTSKWRDKDGNLQEETQWHNLECWGEYAKKMESSVRTGTEMSIVGELKYCDWTDKAGVKHKLALVKVLEYILLGTKKN